MEEDKRYFRLGLFVVLTLSVLAAVLFLLGGRKLFQPTFTFETYFNESVAGLELGAPIRFRGVPLGQVSEILTSTVAYERDVPLDKRRAYIVVRGKVSFSAEEADQMQRDAIQLVKRGLRAQTQLAGITGQQYLAVDLLDPAKYPPLEFQWTPKYTYIPSAPSLTGQIVANAQAFLASLNEADIKALGQNLNALVVDLDKKLNEARVGELAAVAHDLLKNASSTFERIDHILADAPVGHTLHKLDSVSTRVDALFADPGLKQTIDSVAVISRRVRKLAEAGDLDRMVKRINEAVERLDAIMGDNQYDVHAIVQDLRVTADNLRVVSETIKRYPAGALLAGPPDKVQLPRTSR
jgi:phospholipid/cholesterol/gamma-HCH transport system substrate-binding protein